MVNKPKLQHYVPQFYLKKFATNNDDPKSLYCYDKGRNKTFKSSIRQIAAENYFYDEAKNPKSDVEEKLASLEQGFSTAYNKLIEKKSSSLLSISERETVASFIAMQKVRSPEFRKLLDDVAKELGELRSRGELPTELIHLINDFDGKDFFKSRHRRLLLNEEGIIKNMSSCLLQLRWIVRINKTQIPFWTSDNPVIFENPLDPEKHFVPNPSVLGIIVFFPLTPSIALELQCPYTLPPRNIRSDYVIELDDEHYVNSLNLRQLLWSIKHVYSSANDFSLAKEAIRQNPSLYDIKKRRLNVGEKRTKVTLDYTRSLSENI